MSDLLAAEGLGVRIGAVQVCTGLTLGIAPGECWAVLGRNGTGKTTLLHTLAGLRPPAAGRVLLDGRPLPDCPRRQVARRVGVMFQDYHDPFPATVLETALIGRHPHLGRWEWESGADRELARRALMQTGLAGLEQRPVATLSGGERRRLGLATVLTQDPDLFLLDEPASHLDLNHQISALDHLQGLARKAGKAVAMVLHDPNLARRYCDRALLLFGNGETRFGPTDSLLDRDNLERLYHHPMRAAETPGGPIWFPA